MYYIDFYFTKHIFSIFIPTQGTIYSSSMDIVKMSWDDDNVAQLRELWDQGLLTAQIGKLIGFTKNAVVGKAHRICVERRPSPIRRTAIKPERKKARSPVIPKLNFDYNVDPPGEEPRNGHNGWLGLQLATVCIA